MPQKYGGKLQAAALPDKAATLKCIGAMIAQPIGELFTVCVCVAFGFIKPITGIKC